MAVRNTTKNKSTPAVKREKHRYWRFLIVVLVTLMLLGLLGFGSWWLYRKLLIENNHFVMQRFQISGVGYWSKNQETRNELLQILNLNLNIDNIFAVNPSEVRRELMQIPSVENAVVYRILPDTIRIELNERIPRAYLSKNNSEWVIDSSGKVMPKKQCLEITGRLPVIFGIDSDELYPGIELEKLQPALQLIMTTIQYYPDLRIYGISVKEEDRLEVKVLYREMQMYTAFIPFGDYRQLLNYLQSAIEQALRANDRRSNIDITYANQGVLY